MVTSVLTTIAEGGRSPCRSQAVELEEGQQRGDLVAGEITPVALPVGSQGSEAVGVGIGGQGQVGGVATGRVPRPVHRDRHFRIGRLGDIGKLPVRRHLFLDWNDGKALLDEDLHGGHGADAVQGGEDDLDLVLLRRGNKALTATQLEVSLVRPVIEEVDPAAAHGFGPGQVLDDAHLIDEVGHDLIVRRHGLTAALVVKFAAVVVGRIV